MEATAERDSQVRSSDDQAVLAYGAYGAPVIDPTRDASLLWDWGTEEDMSLTLSGVLHGRRIELDAEPSLPDGALVTVRIERRQITTEEKRSVISATSGAWASDPSLAAIFREIAHGRSAATPRHISLE